MTIWIVRSQRDETSETLYHFLMAGQADDGKIRLASISREETPETWLASNPVEALALINAGRYDEIFERRYLGDTAVTEGKDWLTTNPVARGLVTQDIAVVEAWIDAATVSQLRELLKVLAVAVRVLVKREL